MQNLPLLMRRWFEGRRRPLPWRAQQSGGLRDPYPTWISEIMLQQTRVEAVVPYFEAFLQRFPDVQALAAAPLESVLHAWAGLGYYRRARMLHAAAQQLVHDSCGVFPRTAKELREFPGIGVYTSAAIASLAFGERVPVVDGNVKRVVARWSALELAADAPQLHRAAEQQGAAWMLELPEGDLSAAGELNEALMELGATVCLPRNPDCGVCPVQSSCAAWASQRIAELPLPKRAKKWVDLEMVFLVHRVGVRVLLAERKDGWSPGLYEPPSITLLDEDPEQGVAKLLREPTAALAKLNFAGTVRHTITHHRIRAHIYHGASSARAAEAQWLNPEEVPLTGLGRKVLQHKMK